MYLTTMKIPVGFRNVGHEIQSACVEESEKYLHSIARAEDLKQFIRRVEHISIGWKDCYRENLKWLSSQKDGSKLPEQIESAIVRIERSDSIEEIVKIYNDVFQDSDRFTGKYRKIN
jgi:uncharacterized protein (UPF0335 family)